MRNGEKRKGKKSSTANLIHSTIVAFSFSQRKGCQLAWKKRKKKEDKKKKGRLTDGILVLNCV
jgi:hypothetical protein